MGNQSSRTIADALASHIRIKLNVTAPRRRFPCARQPQQRSGAQCYSATTQQSTCQTPAAAQEVAMSLLFAESQYLERALGRMCVSSEACERWPRDGREIAERQPRDGRETAERQPRDSRETAERQPRDSREIAERQPRDSRATAER